MRFTQFRAFCAFRTDLGKLWLVGAHQTHKQTANIAIFFSQSPTQTDDIHLLLSYLELMKIVSMKCIEIEGEIYTYLIVIVIVDLIGTKSDNTALNTGEAHSNSATTTTP